MVHIYCGNGKGKTTAAVGLAIRAAGKNIPVLFAQFLKYGGSGELEIMKNIPRIDIRYVDKAYGFSWQLDEAGKKEQIDDYAKFIKEIEIWIDNMGKNEDLIPLIPDKDNSLVVDTEKREDTVELVVVLDEILDAVNCHIIDENILFRLIDKYSRNKVEFILTGRNPSVALSERADYISNIEAVKHPYKNGIKARCGIEY